MSFLYDDWGWYAGEGSGPRSTDIAPANTSQTTTPGEPRANWSGFAWVDLAYFPPLPDPIPETPVPTSVTRRQARQALLLAGKLDLVQPAIDAIADPIQRGLVQIEWDDSLDFIRTRPTLIALASAIGMTSADIDNLFILAASLE